MSSASFSLEPSLFSALRLSSYQWKTRKCLSVSKQPIREQPWEKIKILPVSWYQWPRWRGILGNVLHHLQCCQTNPSHHHQGTVTGNTDYVSENVLDYYLDYFSKNKTSHFNTASANVCWFKNVSMFVLENKRKYWNKITLCGELQ